MNLGQFGNRPGLIRPPSFTPGGYLTPVSGTPAISGDATVTTAFYTPDQHNALPLLRAGVYEAHAFNEATLSLAGLLANNIYDLLAYSDGRFVRFGWSTAWQSSAAGAGDRGSGLGTPELLRRDGLLVNKNPIVVSMAGQARGISAGAGTYVGSVSIGSVAGQVVCQRSYGQSRRWDVWNAYNRKPVVLRAGDATANWTYNTNTVRPARNDATNSLTLFSGLAEDVFDLRYIQDVFLNGNSFGSSTTVNHGIGFNSTTVMSGALGFASFSGGSGASVGTNANCVAQLFASPSMGINVATALEVTTSNSVGTGGAVRYGTEASMQMSANWRA